MLATNNFRFAKYELEVVVTFHAIRRIANFSSSTKDYILFTEIYALFTLRSNPGMINLCNRGLLAIRSNLLRGLRA